MRHEMTKPNRPAATGTVATTNRHQINQNSKTMNAMTVTPRITNPKNRMTAAAKNAPDSRERPASFAVRRPQPADRPSFRLPATADGWRRLPACNPAVLDLLHRRDRPSLIPDILGNEPWVLGLSEMATRVGVKGRRFAAEVPTFDGAQVQTGRLIFATTEGGRLRAYHEGEPGFVWEAARCETDWPIAHLQSVTDALAWIRAVGIEAGVVAEVGNNRNPAPSRGGEFADRNVVTVRSPSQTTAASDEFLLAHLRAVRGFDEPCGGRDFRPRGFAVNALARIRAAAANDDGIKMTWGGDLSAPPADADLVAIHWFTGKSSASWGHRFENGERWVWEAGIRDRSRTGAVRGRPACLTCNAR